MGRAAAGDGMKPRGLCTSLVRRAAGLATLALSLWGTTACKSDPPGGAGDAGGPLPSPSDAATTDGPLQPQTLDFTVIGCPQFDGSKPACRGPAPLTVSFAPINGAGATRFLWDFGDGLTSSEAFPTHTYAVPDKYSVTLLAAPNLSSPVKKDFIEVVTNPAGGACDVGVQCTDDLACLCGQGAECPAAFSRGICTSSCANAPCATGSICASLGYGLPASAAPPVWRAPHCLRACSNDSNCGQGQRCRLVPVAGATLRWERACFYAFPGETGSNCRGPGGVPQDDLCLGGRCVDFGAQGICSVDCSVAPCPERTTCATFNDGRRLCLPRCEGASSCRSDPLLACAGAGDGGPFGFTVPASEPATATFCAPKRCSSDVDCEHAGICSGSPAGHCIRRPIAP